jgi:hypothetical protein
MASFASVLGDEEIWDLVNFVLSIPFDGEESAYPTKLPDEDEAGKQKVAASKD